MRHVDQPYRFPVSGEQVPVPEHLDSYESAMTPYLPAVNSLEYHLSAGVQPEALPGYLGSGEDKHAFLIDSSEGPSVAKFFKGGDFLNPLQGSPPDKTESLLTHTEPLIAGKGGVNMEQLVAANPNRGEAGVIITSYEPGRRMQDVEDSELEQITDEHLKRLNETLRFMRERNLNPHNFDGILFDPDTGFHFVDYELVEPDHSRPTVTIDRIDAFLHNALRDHKAVTEALGGLLEFYVKVRHEDIERATRGKRRDIREQIVDRARELFPDGE